MANVTFRTEPSVLVADIPAAVPAATDIAAMNIKNIAE
jgi:hypothetical protein